MTATKVKLRGDGNAIWEFDLPLSEVFADQVRTRRLVPVDEENHELVADLFTDPATAAEPEQEEARDDGSQGEKSIDDMNLVELLEHAEKVGVPADQLDPLRKPGTSKDAVRQAIRAHLGQQ